MTTPAPRWPWTELRTALRAAGYRTRPQQTEVLGITLRTLERWKAHDVPDPSADRAALAIGSHPAIIWTDWYALGQPMPATVSAEGHAIGEAVAC